MNLLYSNNNAVKLPPWYKPIDPVLQEFLKEYHNTSTKMTRRKYTNMFPCIYSTPYRTELGSCTLLKRTLRSKLRYSNPTTVTFVNFSKYELDITVTSIATTMKGCGIGIMGNSITMDVNKTEPKEQVIKLKPVLYKENLVSRVRDDERVINHFTKKSIKQKSNKMFLIIPKCLAASTALIDPCTHSYYLTVKVCHPQKKCKPIMVDLIHSSGYDVIFNDENTFLEPEDRNIGYVFQDFALFPHINAESNIKYAMSPDDNDLFDEIINMLDLKDHLKKMPHELSGGQQQRIAIGRSLLKRPMLLLLDEPFSNLDQKNKISAQDLIMATINKLEITCILVSHDSSTYDGFIINKEIIID